VNFLQLHLPATNDDGASAYFADGYTGERKDFEPYRALWPARYSREKFEEIFGVIHPYYKCAQYDLVPSLGDLSYFLMDQAKRHQGTPPTHMWWMAIDAAQTATATGSETALVAVGEKPGRQQGMALLGARAGRWRPEAMYDQSLDFMHEMTRIQGRGPCFVLIERAAGGYGLHDRFLQQYGPGLVGLEGVVPVGSKEDRAADVCYLVNRGMISFPENPAGDIKKLETQLRNFPLCRDKDLVDAFVHCLKFVISPRELRDKTTEQNSGQIYDTMGELDDFTAGDTFDEDYEKLFGSQQEVMGAATMRALRRNR
jgi:phage terminase large subunit-like protein